MKRNPKAKRKVGGGGRRLCDISSAILDAIECITTVPGEAIVITVHDGWVRLEGVLPDWSQKETVENVVRRVPGVKGVISLIRVDVPGSPPPRRRRGAGASNHSRQPFRRSL